MTTEDKVREELRGAVARGWCAPVNAHKVMDVDLGEAIVQEVLAFAAEQQRVGAERMREFILTEHEPVHGTQLCRCGHKLNDYNSDDVTWEEHVRALEPIPAPGKGGKAR